MAKHLKIQTCLNFLEADMWPENAEFIADNFESEQK